MYAIIETGGKQYRVQRGDVIDIERMPVSGKKVRQVSFDRVLMVSGEGGTQLGAPTLADARVSGVVLDEVRGTKVKVFKMKRRKGYRRTHGHRQDLLRVRGRHRPFAHLGLHQRPQRSVGFTGVKDGQGQLAFLDVVTD